jgi:PAS domain S-box-containing protein
MSLYSAAALKSTGASDRAHCGRSKRWLSVPRFSHWSIGARIAAVVLTLAVPLNLVIAGVVWHLSEAASETQRTSLLYAARSVAAAVDAKLGEYMALAQALARSPALFEDDLAVFEAEARRAFTTPDAWVLVSDAEGQQLFNMARRPDQPLPVRNPFGFAAQKRAFETRTPVIADVRLGTVSQEWIINIEIPIFKNGQPFRSLAVVLKAELFMRLLNAQHMPENWLACIIDHQGRFIVRVPGYERSVGQLAAEGFRKVKDQEGIFEFLSFDGDPIVTANAHSTVSGWPVGIAVKKAALQTAAWSTVRWAAILAGTLSFLSLLFAGVISRRITGPIAALRQSARTLLTSPQLAKPPHGPPEVSDLWEAMKQSAACRDRSDQALRESEERLRLANEAGGIGTFTVDVEAGRADYSPELAAMVGMPGVRTVSIEDAFARMHRDDVASARLKFAAGLSGAGRGQIKGDFRFVRPGGEIRWMAWTGRVEFRDEPSGRTPFRIVGACVDITEQKQAEAALRESEQRLRGIFEHAGTGIVIKDLDGRFQSCNPAYATMLGYGEEELRGLHCQDLMHPEDCAANTTLQYRLIAGEIPSFEILTRYFSKEGKILWGHRHVSLLKDAAGSATNLIVLVTNMTGQQRHEEHIRLLLREVNHRCKNMLTLVQAVARQTLATKPEDFVRRFAERIQALAASQDLLVKNAWKGVDLDELARSQLAHFKDLIGTRIVLKGPSLLISASAAQTIGMALHELATNAGKYGALINGEGQVKIEWGLERTETGKVTFRMSWREQGGPPVTVPSHSGFGSTVIRDLAEKSLDANIDLRFADTGLTWRLSCGAEEVLEGNRSAPAARSTKPCRIPARSGKRPRVLVVEDEPFAAMEIAQILDAAGFDVAGPVGSVAAALELLKRLGCDAALLDINLGSETSEQVALELTKGGTPFATLSGYSREQLPAAFRGAPALAKPFRPQCVIAELRKCIEQKNSESLGRTELFAK